MFHTNNDNKKAITSGARRGGDTKGALNHPSTDHPIGVPTAAGNAGRQDLTDSRQPYPRLRSFESSDW